MRFWDSSALVPLLTEERMTPPVRREYALDTALLVWWGTLVECASALARKERDGALGGADARAARRQLKLLASSWVEVEPGETVRALAVRLVAVHPLRAGDALQLAAALTAAEGDPASLELVTLDERLADAAAREGFPFVFPA